MKNIILLILFCFYSIFSFAQIKENQAIDSIFSKWNKPNTPGCALGIIKNGELIYAKGYGSANMEYDIPNSASSVLELVQPPSSLQPQALCV